MTTPSGPYWWDELAAEVEQQGHQRHSATWYEAMCDAYLERYPQSDERSKQNMRDLWRIAAEREADAS